MSGPTVVPHFNLKYDASISAMDQTSHTPFYFRVVVSDQNLLSCVESACLYPLVDYFSPPFSDLFLAGYGTSEVITSSSSEALVTLPLVLTVWAHGESVSSYT